MYKRQSYYNALTHQRMRIVSTGKFTIDTDNNPVSYTHLDVYKRQDVFFRKPVIAKKEPRTVRYMAYMEQP